MNLRRIGRELLFLSLTTTAIIKADTFSTVTYNFQLPSSGGGMDTLLNGVDAETFCDDFAHNIWVPYTYNNVNVSTMTSASDLSQTRFGGVSSWTQISIGDASTQTTINNANALARYQMVGYLTTLYNLPQGANAYNDGIQEAIWTIMDPTGTNVALPNIGDATSALNTAASWYSSTTASQRDYLLSAFNIITDPASKLGPSCGFQEQITGHLAPVPEPRTYALLIVGLLTMGWMGRRKLSVSLPEAER
jgi:PEP-CTERM motif-containing protein